MGAVARSRAMHWLALLSGRREIPADWELESLLPDAERRVADEETIARPPEEVYLAFKALKLSDMPLARALGAIRGLGLSRRAEQERSLWEELLRLGCVQLADEPGKRLAVGLVGKVFRVRLGIEPVAAREDFVRFAEPGSLKLAASCRFEGVEGKTRVLLEARVKATSPEAAQRLRRDWVLIRPGAFLVARSGLAALRRRAEGK